MPVSQILQVRPERSSFSPRWQVRRETNLGLLALVGRTMMIEGPIGVEVEPLQPKFKHFSIIFKYIFSNLKHELYFTTKLVNIQF